MNEHAKKLAVLMLTTLVVVVSLKRSSKADDAINSIKLYYFAVNGRAEIIRLILHQAGVRFEDIRVTKDEWAKNKPMGSPWGQLPYVEVDGKVLGQSMTISRYFAGRYGLAGDNEFEKAKCDETAEAVLDMRPHVQAAVMASIISKDLEKARQEFAPGEEAVKKILRKMDKQIAGNKNGFLVGTRVRDRLTGEFSQDDLVIAVSSLTQISFFKLSWADLFLVDHTIKFKAIKPNILDDLPNVAKLHDYVLTQPNIKKYHASAEYIASITN